MVVPFLVCLSSEVDAAICERAFEFLPEINVRIPSLQNIPDHGLTWPPWSFCSHCEQLGIPSPLKPGRETAQKESRQRMRLVGESGCHTPLASVMWRSTGSLHGEPIAILVIWDSGQDSTSGSRCLDSRMGRREMARPAWLDFRHASGTGMLVQTHQCPLQQIVGYCSRLLILPTRRSNPGWL